jgi:hypothetical protein
MAAEPVPVPKAICEVCWLIDHTDWEPESMDSRGNIIMRLTGVEMPNKVDIEAVEVCEDCGSITVAGIYEMRTLSTVEDEDEIFTRDQATSFTFSIGESNDDNDDGDSF